MQPAAGLLARPVATGTILKLFCSLTSPYARVARIAILEKGLAGEIGQQVVDPWADPPELLPANPLVRVPTLLLDDGTGLSEAMMIVHYLERRWPEPAVIPAHRIAPVLACAGAAMGVIDSSVHALLGRRVTPDAASFDQHVVGQRRWRGMARGLDWLEAHAPPMPEAGAGVATLDLIAVGVALDYLPFRFPEADWLGSRPRLAALRRQLAGRPAFAGTLPRNP